VGRYPAPRFASLCARRKRYYEENRERINQERQKRCQIEIHEVYDF
jgi:hypothetical protein